MISRSANLFRTFRLFDNSIHFAHFVRMIGQSKISSFFSPKGSKKEAAVTVPGNENVCLKHLAWLGLFRCPGLSLIL